MPIELVGGTSQLAFTRLEQLRTGIAGKLHALDDLTLPRQRTGYSSIKHSCSGQELRGCPP
jgi:hypothetical protein